MEETSHDVVVIGSGVAGLAAAKEVLAGGLSVAVLESVTFGGLVINVNVLDGAIEGSGADYASTLMLEMSESGGEQISAVAESLARDGDRLAVRSDAGVHRARAVIVASGAQLKRLGIPGELELEHKGVSQCADCDGYFFRDQEVAVAGGGDSALQSALVLAGMCAKVHLLVRGGSYRAKPSLVAAVAAQPKIVAHMNTTATAVLGTHAVTGVRIRDASGERELAVSGFFGFVGLEPAAGFLPDAIARDASGAIVTDAALATAMPGVFAAGAVRAGYRGMLADARDEGVLAARSAKALLGR